MEERSVDVFFAGQIRHDLPRSDYRYWVSTSKFVAREQLWRELNRLEALGQWNIDRGNIAGTDRASHADQFNTYSQKMMNSRVCVAPRGSVAELYRAFEGARAGCLVVANRLPNRSYLSSAPFIQVDHWRELEDILLKYGRNLDLLERARAATLAWWKNHIAVDRVGTYVAQHINQASAAATGN